MPDQRSSLLRHSRAGARSIAMRLSPDQVSTIVACVRQNFGDGSSVALFGSRLDDSAHGGDVGLLVETETRPTLRQRALATMTLEQALNLPVDIVATQRGTPSSAFGRIARSRPQALAAGAGMQGACLPPKEVHRD